MGQIVPVAQAKKDLAALLGTPNVQKQLAAALPRVGITPERMVRFALTALNRSPGLAKCEPTSFLGCVVQSAQLGLDPSGITGEAYLVPFKDACTFIIGYRGLLKLARRSGKISEAAAHVVRAADKFEYEYGLDAKLVHKPAEGDRGDVTHAYAYAKFTDGGRVFEVMSRAEIEKVRSQSKASSNGPWVTHPDEMARKTVFRRLAKWLPLEPEEYHAVEIAGQEESGMKQDLAGVLAADATVTDTPKDPAPAAQPQSSDFDAEESRRLDAEAARSME